MNCSWTSKKGRSELERIRISARPETTLEESSSTVNVTCSYSKILSQSLSSLLREATYMTWLATLRRPAASSNGTSYLRAYQKRWAQVHNVRLLATHQIPDSIMARYKDKLSKKAKEWGKYNSFSPNNEKSD
jgi:hypothetical protein